MRYFVEINFIKDDEWYHSASCLFIGTSCIDLFFKCARLRIRAHLWSLL